MIITISGKEGKTCHYTDDGHVKLSQKQQAR